MIEDGTDGVLAPSVVDGLQVKADEKPDALDTLTSPSASPQR